MSDDQRLRITCPKCDHPIVSVPAGYRFDSDLICPGCGETVVVSAAQESLVEKAEKAVARALGQNKGKAD